MAELPSGTVTLLFSDIEGSTRLLQRAGDAYADLLDQHRSLLRDAFERHDGVEVDAEGDAFFVAFAVASEAVAAAVEAQRAIATFAWPESADIRVRIGVHTGAPRLMGSRYVGLDVHRAARVMAAGHGGQVLVTQTTRELVGEEFELRDLGEHRLKDLLAPVRLYQLGSDDFPPPKSLNQTNLPVQPTPLVGREGELAEVLGLLRSNRLVTLTGPGGSGKTRLALQAASEVVEDYPDGIWFVPLGALTDPELVQPTIASIVGAKDDAVEFLKQKRLLLLLDNLEQLLPGAAAKIAELIAAPDVKVLTTSRERLALSAEQEYVVPMLPLDDAIALFTVRARQLKLQFESDEHVSAIAVRLDGLPLALELAAARVKVLTPQQIADRLGASLDLLTVGARDVPERQQTLRATIEWSYKLLSEQEQHLFARLSVFAGGSDLEAADAVCKAVLDTLQSLIDKSLLRQTEDGRFFMLETIREYALERLEASREADELRLRHATHYLAYAEQSADLVHTSTAASRMDHVARDQGNFRAALGWALEREEAELALRFGVALGHFWLTHNYLADARRWRTEAMVYRHRAPPLVRARALGHAGKLAFYADDDHEGAEPLLEESVALLAELGSTEEIPSLLNTLGAIALSRGDRDQALAYRKESLALSRQTGNRAGEMAALHHLGEAYRDLNDFARGEALLEESVELGRELGDLYHAAHSLHSLGDLALDQGDLGRARTRYLEGLDPILDADDHRGAAHCLAGIASAVAREGRHEQAAVLWGAVEQLEETEGWRILGIERRRYEHGLVSFSGNPSWERGYSMGLDEAVSYARSIH
jgi:predicted ATPase/class 3 adenylate cyclase